MIRLVPRPLTPGAFAPYGEVIQTDGATRFSINQGTTTRFHALATADPGPDGATIVSIFRGTRRPMPLQLSMLERHPLASQAFVPLSPDDWLVAVASEPTAGAVICFRARGDQGVNYAAGVWHHPLLVLTAQQDFLVVDRDGPGENLEVRELNDNVVIDL